MGVYISGMEMPMNCDKCLYSSWSNFYQIYVCDAIRKSEPVLFDKKQVNSTDTVRSGRADNCPLVNIPPHGRLGDLDAAVELAMQYCHDDDGTCSKAGADLRDLLDEIENLPTIIPAEEGE